MRTFFSLALFLFSFTYIYSQPATYNRDMPAIGKLSGIVIDADTRKPVEFATIAVIRVRDQKPETGGVANEKGFFMIEQIKPGKYFAKISFIGYESFSTDTFMILPQAPEKNLGTIRLNNASKKLNEVVVSGDRGIMQMSIDKKVFNVDKNLLSEGGNAGDVLQTIPSVTTDVDGNINLRGSGNVTVLIDGKPSSLAGSDMSALLQQIPANTIESVELITNPSAKYDPDGMSGIINIVLKKNKKDLFSGSANVSAGTSEQYTAGLNLNYRKNKWNTSVGLGVRSNQRTGSQKNLRQNIFSDTTFYSNQYSDRNDLIKGINARVGIDYSFNNKNTLGVNTTYNIRNRKNNSDINYENLDANNSLSSRSVRTSRADDEGNNLDASIYYKKLFARPKEELYIEGTLSQSSGDRTENFSQEYFNADGNPFNSNAFLQRSDNIDNSYVNTLKLDYSYPVDEFSKIETGFKSSFRNVDADIRAENFDTINSEYVNNPNVTNHFVFDEQVHAVYGIYSRTINKFGFQVGLRAEQAYTSADQISTGEKFNNDYFSLFPSIYFSYKLEKDQELQLNYSRRINRPSVNNLNPFVDYEDPQNLRRGNPTLKPEYIDSYEWSYLKYWGRNSFTSTLYFRQINGTIQRFRTIDTSGVSTVTFINLDKSRNYGLEFTANTELVKNWSLLSNLNLFQSNMDGTNLGGELKSSNFNYWLKITSSTKIPKWFDIQISGNYNSPNQGLQGKSKPMYSMDLGLKKDLWKNKATVNFTLSDVFDTRKFEFESQGEGFIQHSEFKRLSRIATIGFTYRFGKSDLQNRKRTKQEESPNQNFDGMEGF
jgi:outer membrane receptor protein involved in Fe transport